MRIAIESVTTENGHRVVLALSCADNFPVSSSPPPSICVTFCKRDLKRIFELLKVSKVFLFLKRNIFSIHSPFICFCSAAVLCMMLGGKKVGACPGARQVKQHL